MTFEEWWKKNGIEQATYAEKMAARKGWFAGREAGATAEREECAKVCEGQRYVEESGSMDCDGAAMNMAVDECVAAIRARSKRLR